MGKGILYESGYPILAVASNVERKKADITVENRTIFA
jgi:hypothetical protein